MKGTKVMGACMGLLALALVGFVACDNGTTNGQEKPEALNEQITLTFGENGPYTATVKGPEMLGADRTKAVANVKAMIEGAYREEMNLYQKHLRK